jgi:hypothetical protein
LTELDNILRQYLFQVLCKILELDHVQNAQSRGRDQWLTGKEHPDIVVSSFLPKLKDDLARQSGPNGVVDL